MVDVPDLFTIKHVWMKPKIKIKTVPSQRNAIEHFGGSIYHYLRIYTLPPIIMEVEHGVLEDVFSLQMGYGSR